jgi:hypothetical protein
MTDRMIAEKFKFKPGMSAAAHEQDGRLYLTRTEARGEVTGPYGP